MLASELGAAAPMGGVPLDWVVRQEFGRSNKLFGRIFARCEKWRRSSQMALPPSLPSKTYKFSTSAWQAQRRGGRFAEMTHGSNTLSFAQDLIKFGMQGLLSEGESGAFQQAFMSNPGTLDLSIDVEYRELDEEAGAAYIRERIASGFNGIAGYSCVYLEAATPHIRAEALDSRDGRGVMLAGYIRRTLFGKIRPEAEIDILGTTSLR